MAGIRTDARQSAASASSALFATKWTRRAARWQKEAALRPHEGQKAALERQLIQLERLEHWLESLL
jgi:hypothetical protein